jgi:hypothetical protein
MIPKPPTAAATGVVAGAETTGDTDGLVLAEATPGPTNAANAATTAMIAAPRLHEVFLAISLSLSLSAHCA